MSPDQRLESLILPAAQRLAALEAIRPSVSPEHFEWIEAMAELLPEVLALLQQKNMSIGKLRELVFGPRTESLENVCQGLAKAPPIKKKPKGHGRKSHRDYTGAKRVAVAHDTLKPGDLCPDCTRGKVRGLARPATAIAIHAQPPIGALIHEMQRLRCDGCGKVFTAQTPPEAGCQKYDPSVGVMVGLMRYGSGMPFYRLERLQQSLGVPIASSVQWEQVQQCAQSLEPILDHLIYLAAQSSVVFNDDTTMRVGQLCRQIQAETNPKRTGIFTSGVVAHNQAHPIALFFTGRDHAGENLARVLNHRESDLPPPLHMADGLARNDPKGHETQACTTTVWSNRNPVDLSTGRE
jgi:transposase